ncbi:MAG: DNA mismatch repair protein MutS [Bacilli bacterium]|nr:DNA mismatch repair protein MutS [Bacilli bacterium]
MDKEKKIVYTPMIEQYLQIKRDNPDVLIMYRLGDFYEFFFEDAEIVSKELQLVLTKKSAGNNRKIPMCGIPHHAYAPYLAKLIDAGHKVGIVEQVEDPSSAKGIVKREIIQIVTPGSIVDFEDSEHNFIIAVDAHLEGFKVSYADVSTGDIFVSSLPREDATLVNYISGLNAREIVVSPTFSNKLLGVIKTNLNIVISFEDNVNIPRDYDELFLDVSDAGEKEVAKRLVSYLTKTKKRQLSYFKAIKVSKTAQFLQIDAFSRLNLELTRTVRNETKYGSLFWLLDETTTAMGRRKLKDFIIRPSRDYDEIIRRQNIVNTFIVNYITREEIKEHFRSIYDLERIVARIAFGTANPRDLLRLKTSLISLEKAWKLLGKIREPEISALYDDLASNESLIRLIDKAISEDAPLQISGGDIFKYGYYAPLDELIDLSHGGKKWISAFEEQEKDRTGIRNLKVGYNRVFGYFIEVSNSNLNLVRDEFGYIRKQTTKNGERYINEALKEKETLILSAEEKRQQLEKELFNSLLIELQKSTRILQKSADAVSEIDVYLALAEVAVNNSFVRPTFNKNRVIKILNARHPVLSKLLKDHAFVANDIVLDEKTDVLIITGPNMGGKSTLMRQLALIVIMAQIGSFVPAESASLMLFDQIFTRIGASDDLISGQSTFMVEMIEANYALRKATTNSLLLFDEIGRGTSTYDGMALAYAMLEYIAKVLKVKTLFSTHYHEITMIEDNYGNIKNIHVEVKEIESNVTFLYKIKEGPMNKSYGINVARLAGLPLEILNNAQNHLHSFSNEPKNVTITNEEYVPLKPLWYQQLENIKIEEMTPLEALIFLKKIKDEGFK